MKIAPLIAFSVALVFLLVMYIPLSLSEAVKESGIGQNMTIGTCNYVILENGTRSTLSYAITCISIENSTPTTVASGTIDRIGGQDPLVVTLALAWDSANKFIFLFLVSPAITSIVLHSLRGRRNPFIIVLAVVYISFLVALFLRGTEFTGDIVYELMLVPLIIPINPLTYVMYGILADMQTPSSISPGTEIVTAASAGISVLIFILSMRAIPQMSPGLFVGMIAFFPSLLVILLFSAYRTSFLLTIIATVIISMPIHPSTPILTVAFSGGVVGNAIWNSRDLLGGILA